MLLYETLQPLVVSARKKKKGSLLNTNLKKKNLENAWDSKMRTMLPTVQSLEKSAYHL